MPNGSLDSQLFLNRARAERAVSLSSQGSGLNPIYVSVTPDQKPTDYVPDTGIAFGAYPVAGSLLQKVQWNEGTQAWDDFGDPVHTVKSIQVDSIADLNFPGVVDGQTIQVNNFYADLTGGGGPFYWKPNEDKANHNGGTVIDPDHSATPGSEAWYSSENSGNGCWVRAHKEIISPEDYGCKGDGVTKDTWGFDAMLKNHTDISATRHYLLDSLDSYNKSINIAGNNKGIIDWSQDSNRGSSPYNQLTFSGTYTQMADLGADISYQDREITFDSDHNLIDGDLFLIYNPTANSFSPYRDYRNGQICKVFEVISSTKVSIKYPSYEDYGMSDVEIYKVDPVEVHISGVSLVGERLDIPQDNSGGLAVSFSVNSTVKDIVIKGGFEQCIGLNNSYAGYIGRIYDNTKDKGVIGYGYAIKIGSSCHCIIENAFLHGWNNISYGSGVDLKIPNRDILFNNIKGHTSIDGHGDMDGCTITNSDLLTAELSGKNGVVSNCSVENIANGESIGGNFKITDNELKKDCLIHFAPTPNDTIYGDQVLSITGNRGKGTIKTEFSSYEDNNRYSLVFKDNLIYRDFGTNGFYADEYVLNINGSRFNSIDISKNSLYGRVIINLTNNNNATDIIFEDNYIPNTPFSVYIVGESDNMQSTIFCKNNKIIDVDRSNYAGQSFFRVNLAIQYFKTLYLEDNYIGDTVASGVGDWITLYDIDNVYLNNNNNLLQPTNKIKGSNITVNRQKGGSAYQQSGKSIILSGEHSVTVDPGLILYGEVPIITGSHAEVSNCIVSSLSGVNFVISTADSSNVTADRTVYWTIGN